MDPVTADELRWLGEEADGRRQKDLALVWLNGKLRLLSLDDPRTNDADNQVVTKDGPIHVRTEFEGEGGMKGGKPIAITYGGKQLPVGDADAAFFTQSAVEKFVLPYYTRVWSPAQIQALKNKLFAGQVVAALHDPPSITRAAGDPSNFKPIEFDESTGDFKFREES